jgi:hypothetical protein
MGEGDDGGIGGAVGAAGRSAGEFVVFDEGLDEMWPARASSAEMLAQVWEHNPAMSASWTSSHAGGVA